MHPPVPPSPARAAVGNDAGRVDRRTGALPTRMARPQDRHHRRRADRPPAVPGAVRAGAGAVDAAGLVADFGGGLSAEGLVGWAVDQRRPGLRAAPGLDRPRLYVGGHERQGRPGLPASAAAGGQPRRRAGPRATPPDTGRLLGPARLVAHHLRVRRVVLRGGRVNQPGAVARGARLGAGRTVGHLRPGPVRGPAPGVRLVRHVPAAAAGPCGQRRRGGVGKLG